MGSSSNDASFLNGNDCLARLSIRTLRYPATRISPVRRDGGSRAPVKAVTLVRA